MCDKYINTPCVSNRQTHYYHPYRTESSGNSGVQLEFLLYSSKGWSFQLECMYVYCMYIHIAMFAMQFQINFPGRCLTKRSMSSCKCIWHFHLKQAIIYCFNLNSRAGIGIQSYFWNGEIHYRVYRNHV